MNEPGTPGVVNLPRTLGIIEKEQATMPIYYGRAYGPRYPMAPRQVCVVTPDGDTCCGTPVARRMVEPFFPGPFLGPTFFPPVGFPGPFPGMPPGGPPPGPPPAM